MIATINVSEDILKRFKGFEIHSYYDNFSIPIAYIEEAGQIKFIIYNADYDRISACIKQLRG